MKRPESDLRQKRNSSYLKTVFGVVSRIKQSMGYGLCDVFQIWGDLSLIRLNWGMLHLTFMLRTLKMVYSVCGVSVGRRAWRRQEAESPGPETEESRECVNSSLSEELRCLMSLSPTDSGGHHLPTTHLPQNDRIYLHLICSFKDNYVFYFI